MTARIEHFVFTNLGVGISDERWLLYRLKLFKTITVPSMAAQSCQSFCWTIFIDQQFPQVFREELQDCLQRWALNVQLVEVMAYDLIQHSIKKILMDSQAELVISTRIDDDDVAANFHHSTGHDGARLELAQTLALFKQFGKTFSHG